VKSKRVILDSNVYESIFLRYVDSLKKMVEEEGTIVYGCSIIRKELREIPQDVKYLGKSFRNSLLSVYDKFTGKHSYPVESVVDFIAEEYWKEYEGGISKRKLMNDFRIVAVASIHNLGIIVSDDDHSMKSKPAIKAYMMVNGKNAFRTPAFYSINEFFP